MLNSSKLCLAMLAVPMIAASGVAKEKGKRVDGQVVKLLGGEKGVSLISSAKKVEAYRIKPEKYGAPKDAKLIANFPWISGPHKVDAGHAKVLQRTLFNKRTYDFNSAKGCEFAPGIVIRFKGDKSSLDVIFCFSCDEIRVEIDGKRVGAEDIDRARGTLVTVMKQIFPKDAAIQSLKLSR